MIAQQPVTPEPEHASPLAQPAQLAVSTTPAATTAVRPSHAPARTPLGLAAASGLLLGKALLLAVLVVLVAFGILGTGLNLTPMLGQPALAAGPPQPAPVLPPAVPIGARADWAEWSYVQQINQVWGKDWPRVIEWFEEFNARYPGNPMVFDKLYAAYVEDGRRLMTLGEYDAARERFEEAVRFDPSRPEAKDFLTEVGRRQSGH